MTKSEKLDCLIRGEKGNFILFHPILMHFAARFHNKTYSEFVKDYKILVKANLHCLDEFDHDAVSLISDPYRETSAFGAKVSFPKDSVPLCKDPIVHSLDDVKALRNPDIYKTERTLDRIKGAEYYDKLLKGKVPIIGWIEGPLAEACDLAGDSDVLMKMILEPDFVKVLMEKCLITAKEFAKAQIEAGCTVMGVGDSICSQISPELYKSIIFPLHSELFNYIHSLNIYVKLHICGNITHLLPQLKNIDIDIVDIDWMVDINKAHEFLGENIIICGNLDPVSVIQDLPASELYRRSKTLIAQEKNKKFIFSGGCEITVNTPIINLKKMKKATEFIKSQNQ